MLLDVSAPTFFNAARCDLDWANLDAIWISHFHLDHVGGLAPFLFGTKYAAETQDRTKPMRVFGPRGLIELLKTFDSACNYGVFEQPFPLEITEVAAGEKFEILPNIIAETYSTKHTDESLAIKINDGRKTFVFTSDTGYDEQLSEFARNADLLLTESSFVEKSPIWVHIGTPESVYLTNLAAPRRALFTHFYGHVWDAADFQTEVAKHQPVCEIIEAVDNLQIEI